MQTYFHLSLLKTPLPCFLPCIEHGGQFVIIPRCDCSMIIGLVSEFANIGFIVLALYSAICKADMVGCMIAVGIFLLSHIVYAVCFKYFDNH